MMNTSIDHGTIFVFQILVILATIIAFVYGYIRDSVIAKYERKRLGTNYIIRRILPLTLLVLSGELSFMGFISTSENNTAPGAQEDLSIRIEKVATELSESSQTLLDIQIELENRISTVEELKKEAEIAESMISLTEEQVAAIQSKLNQELEESNGKSLIYNIIISTVFFLLGLIAQPIYSFFKERKGAQEQQDQQNKSTKRKYTDEEIERAILLLATIDDNKKDATH